LSSRGVLDARSERRASAGAQAVELRPDRRQGEVAEQCRDLIGQLVHHLDEEVGAAARRIEHREVEQLLGGGGGIARSERPHVVDVGGEARADRPAHEMPHEVGARVIDAAPLAPALVGQPQQLALAYVGRRVGWGGHIAVGALVVDVVTIRHREAQGEQALVDVAEVADLEAGEVDADRRVLGVARQCDQRRRERGVGDLGALEQLGAGDPVGGEQVAVVGGQVPRALPRAHPLDQQRDVVPQRGGAGVGGVGFLNRPGCDPRQAFGAVGRVGHRQVPGALGVEQEEHPEHERECSRLELGADGVVGHLQPVSAGPVAELAPEHGQHVLAQDTVQPRAQLLPVVARIVEDRAEAVPRQVGGSEQAQQRCESALQARGVELEVARRRADRLVAGRQQPQPRARGEDPVGHPAPRALGDERTLGQAPGLVEPGEVRRRGAGVDDGDGPLPGLDEVALLRELLDRVSEVVEQLPPARAADASAQLGELRPAG
jgi:hypothetical protein